MKNSAKKLLKKLIYLVYTIFRPGLFRQLKLRFNQFYSMWKSNEFKLIGDNMYVDYPLYLHGGRYIEIGNNFNVGQRLRLEAYDKHLGSIFLPSIRIGNNVSINSDCHIGAINEITIEDGVLIASKVFITDHYHGEITSLALKIPPYARELYTKGPVKIEKNVWVGEGVVILPNVTIGENAIIGANSVISKDVPKNSVFAGNPAKFIREL